MHNFLVLLVSTLGLLMAWTRRVLPLLINDLSGVGRAMLFPQTAAAPSTLQSLPGICDCFACVDVNGLLTISPQCGTPRAVAAPTPGPTFRAAPSPSSNSVWWFAGLATVTGSCASMHRSLPQYQTSPSAADSSGRSRNVRQSGPPRSYGPPVGTVNDFAETTPTPTTASVTVGILPKVLSTSDYNDTLDFSPPYYWKNGNELEVAQRRLQAANLIFNINVNESGPIFEELNTGFQKHCKDNKIVFVTPAPVYSNDGELVSTPNTMPWILAGPKGRAGNRTWVEDPKSLTAFTFTVAALRASPYNNTPNHLSAGIFIFIAPRLRNLIAPIDSLFDRAARLPMHVLHHRCFARRVLHPILASLSDDPTPTSLRSDPPVGTGLPDPDRQMRRQISVPTLAALPIHLPIPAELV
ncbi:hypothetical protein B0H13DRAFT_2305118 [Mycena leptocephala]|nr:hypothetical protein B0H13DRAFT_2305118 [Mycena leptocephala]